MAETTPVADKVIPPDPTKGLAMMSGILGLRKQRQELQTGQYTQQEAQATAQQQAQTARQRAALANWDFTKYDDGTGVVDTTKAAQDPELRKAAGDSYPQLLSQLNTMRSGQLKGKQDYLALQGDELTMVGKITGSMATDEDVKDGSETGRQKLINALSTAKESASPEFQAFLDKRIAGLQGLKLPTGKNKILLNGARTGQLQALDAAGQVTATTPTLGTVQTKGGVQGTATAPPIAGGGMTTVGEPVANVAPPGYFTGTTQQPMVAGPGGSDSHVIGGGPANTPPSSGTPSPATTLRRPDGHAWTGEDGAPGPTAPAQAQEAWGKAREGAQQQVATAREADAGYGKNIAIIGNIRRLADAGGPWSSRWKETMVGSGLGNITDYKLLSAYLESQANALQNTMGLPNTNAGLQGAQTIASKTDYSPEAIRQKSAYLESLVEGAHRYTNALNRVEGFTGNPNPQAVGTFNAAWRNNFDPRIIEGEEAFKRGKESGIDFLRRLTKEMTPQEVADFRRKRANLTMLERGELPQQ